ncbi:hypothetical protein CRG98_028484 [Punica granatum]|uniref:Uncharacterized protein n=1 Tax=Punica granatum TaxID=22663 RepID=A0A2I0J4G2_PUNGR|nr:hypothetical protein CRG98_028484 [Punica granatum]
MPPRRRDRVEDVYDRDNLRHLEQRLDQLDQRNQQRDQRLDRMVEQLTQQMAALMENRKRALIIERQQKRASSRAFGGGVAVARTGGPVRAGGSSAIPGRPMRPANIGPSSSGYVAGGDGEVEFDEEEEIVTRDGVPNLVVRRSCMTPRAANEDWLRNNIFQSTCTIGNKVCRFMIDSGSCENIVSAEAMQKLSLRSEPHPKPYKLAWLKKRGEALVV